MGVLPGENSGSKREITAAWWITIALQAGGARRPLLVSAEVAHEGAFEARAGLPRRPV
jgi:hypothetical protein